MRMPVNVALWLQFKLYLVTLDGYCPESFIHSKPGGLDGDSNFLWMLAVDTIYRCLKCNLVDVWNEQWMAEKDIKNSLGLVDALRDNPPPGINDFAENSSAYWLEPLIFGTSLCKILIEKHDIKKYEGDILCEPFIKEIEDLFESNGVGWSGDFLFSKDY